MRDCEFFSDGKREESANVFAEFAFDLKCESRIAGDGSVEFGLEHAGLFDDNITASMVKMDMLYSGGFLHAIGKGYIPHAALHSGLTLDRREW